MPMPVTSEATNLARDELHAQLLQLLAHEQPRSRRGWPQHAASVGNVQAACAAARQDQSAVIRGSPAGLRKVRARGGRPAAAAVRPLQVRRICPTTWLAMLYTLGPRTVTANVQAFPAESQTLLSIKLYLRYTWRSRCEEEHLLRQMYLHMIACLHCSMLTSTLPEETEARRVASIQLQQCIP